MRSAIRTVGVEEEFLLVHSGTPHLASVGDAVVSTAERLSEGQYEHELQQEQAELGTAPHHGMGNLERDLRARRAALARAAEMHGVRLLASGTSPLDQETRTTADRRYERMGEVYGRLARIQLTCGMHVHVSVESPEEGVAVLDRIRAWLPVLTALSANSPFLAGEDTDYASYRSVLWGQWPTSGTTDMFGSVAAYERARSDLIASGAALDEGMIYFDARLSARYPTVEVRVCDVCADVADAPVLAAVVRGLVGSAARRSTEGEEAPPIRSELQRAARWRAARFGVDGELLDPVSAELVPAAAAVEDLLGVIGPDLDEAGDTDLVRDGLARILERGTGASLQRAAYADGGIASVVDVLAERTTA